MSDEYRTIPSGIPPLDARLGGAVAGRLHVLSGGPGTGKSTASLQFINEGLHRGETVAMLTADRLVDLRSHAAHLGIELQAPLREGRLVLLRYRSSFSALLQHTASPEQMVDDLRRMFLPIRPARLVVDTVSPLLSSAPHSDATVTALAELFEGMDATTLVTYSGDVTAGRGAGYDYRLEPLVERAAAVFHLTRQMDGRGALHEFRASGEPSYQFHVVRVRQPVHSSAPASFTIEAGVGLTLIDPQGAGDRASATSRRLLVLATAQAPSEEILAVPSREFIVESQQVTVGAPIPDPGTEDVGAVLVELRHETIEQALALIQDLSRHPHAVPVIGITRFRLRSADRARALRAGADEVLRCDTGPAELLERLHAAVRRGRGRPFGGARTAPRRAETLIAQPTEPSAGALAAIRYRPLDGEGFARALAAHVAHDHPTQYTVVSLARLGPRTATGLNAPWSAGESDAEASRGQPLPQPTLRELAAQAMRSMRVAGGDLAAIVDGRVCVYLHGARLCDASPFIERVRERWSAEHRAALHVVSLAYPSDEPLLRALMKMDEPVSTPEPVEWTSPADETLSQAGSPK